jgi:3-isopropylmalate/(R)-2-methylmalate dehydratase large subunit
VAAAAFTGKLWFKVPGSISIRVDGGFADRVGAKDLALNVIGSLSADGATYKSVEFSGEAIDWLNMDGRFTIANMAVEMGAKFCPFGFDSKAAEWLSQRGLRAGSAVASDDGATYEKAFEFNASDIVPKVAKPHSVDNVVDASDLRGLAVQQAFLGTCTNGRISDLEAAARVLKGHQIRTGTRMIIAPASRSTLLSAMDGGIISQFLKAGATVVAPGCGPCVGTHAGIPSDGENVISTANRNFKGRMGNNKDVGIYLASPETVAASAIKGEITDPREI